MAATALLMMESMNVGAHWKASMSCGALVTLVAAVHHLYMREFWVQFHSSPVLSEREYGPEHRMSPSCSRT
jgi:hypothetical protein